MLLNHFERSPEPLSTRAERRWAQLAAERPALARAVDLQRRTVGRQIRLMDELEAGATRWRPPDAGETLHLLDGGRPVLRGTSHPLPVETLLPALEAVCRDIAAVTGYAAAVRAAEAFAAGDLDAERLLAQAYDRDQTAVRQFAKEHALVLDIVWLAADLAVGPVLHLRQRAALREDDPESPVRDALDRWSAGHCPACGSWPAMAERFSGERLLRCGACGAGWQRRTDQCIYCDTAGDRFRIVAPDREAPGRTLELCRGCGGYLKGLEAAAPSPFPLIAIEDIGSTDLDHAARQHGFRRPPTAPLQEERQ